MQSNGIHDFVIRARQQTKRKRGQQFIIITVLLLLTTNVSAAVFYVNNPAKADTVFFESDARLEFIKGETNAIVGKIDFDPENAGKVAGKILVDLRMLTTGIASRDQHMHERHLHTDEFPKVVLELKQVTGLPEKLQTDTLYNCLVEGNFSLHGITHIITADSKVFYRKTANGQSEIMIESSFSILLEDYNIPRPKALFLKLAKQINIRVKLFASTANQPAKM